MAFLKYESYKDSRVAWLGEIPSHWVIKRLKFLSKIKTGERDTINKNDDAEYPFFVRSQTVEKIDTYSYDEEAVLTAGDGAGVGKVFHYINGKFDYHQRVYKVSSFREILGKFFFYYMQSNLHEEVIKLSAKSTVDSLRLPMFLNFPVAYGNIEEQEKIIDFLDRKTSEIDQAIAQKQRLIELLQEQKAILINQAVTKGLKHNIPMRDSGIEWLGDIPEHWQVTRLKRLFLEIDDRSTDGSETLLSLRMYAGLVPHDDVSDKPIEDAALVGYKRVYPGQIVMNRMRAAIGLFGVATDFGIVSPDYAIFRPTKDLGVEYYLNLFKTESLKRVFFLESKGLGTGSSGFLRLYSDNFGMIKVPFPPLEEQTEICNHIQEIGNHFSKALKKVEQEINLLKELKSIFVSQAVTGKIKI